MKALQLSKTSPFYLLFCLVPLLIWGVLYWGLSFNGLYGQDAHEYLRYSQRLSEWLQTGNSPGDYFWPVNYPLYGALITNILGSPILSLQLLSLFAIVGSVFILDQVFQYFWPERKQIIEVYLLVFFLGSPYLLRSGMLVMSDALAVFFLCLFLLAYVRCLKQGKLKWVLLAGFAAASVVMTRYAGIVLLVFPALHLLSVLVRQKKWTHLLLGGMVVIGVCLPHFIIRPDTANAFLEHSFLENWHPINWFKRSFVTNTGLHTYRVPNLMYAFYPLFHPGFLVLGCIIFFGWNKKDIAGFGLRVLAASFVLYAIFLAGIPFQNNRFLLLSFPLALLLIFPAFCRLYRRLDGRFWFVFFWVMMGLIQLGIFSRSMQLFVRLNNLEQQVAKEIKAYPPNRLYTFYLDGALESYGAPHKVVNLWKEPLKDVQTGELVLFHPNKFQQQWAGHTLMNNWQFLMENYRLEVIRELPDGWRLYRIE